MNTQKPSSSVPFFARKAGSPIVVRTGVQAGATENLSKRSEEAQKQ